MKKVCAIVLIFTLMFLCVPMRAEAAAGVSAPKQLTVVAGEEETIEISGMQSESVEFSSTNRKIAAVDEGGIVTGKKIGSCQIKITVSSGWETTMLRTKITVVKKKGFSAAKVYKKMMAMKHKYPEGKHWTNNNFYLWKAFPNVRFYAYGCAAFACILSDAAFGKKTLPNEIGNPSPSKVRVGDILRMDHDTHSVIVLKVESDGFVIAEGNFNSSVHWGRKISKNEHIDYLYTRYEGA